jgi:hypothetical protein
VETLWKVVRSRPPCNAMVTALSSGLATAGHRFGYETLARHANADHCGLVLLASVVVAHQNPGVGRHQRSSIDAHANVRGDSTSPGTWPILHQSRQLFRYQSGDGIDALRGVVMQGTIPAAVNFDRGRSLANMDGVHRWPRRRAHRSRSWRRQSSALGARHSADSCGYRNLIRVDDVTGSPKLAE